MTEKLSNPNSKLLLRTAKIEDVEAISLLSARAYQNSGMNGYLEDSIRGQINNFPQGQFVVLVDDKVVGYCATFQISGEVALKPHTWSEITG
ncbi:MAG: carbon-nitrogen hydrolase, partial [Gammaproteobacteria bacterium]|nr:carbon-nitrogen hydrolase [Gammaproteobacteria bacterium]